MAHPNYDAWWKERDARNATKNLQPAMLWVGGLFDAEDCWGAWNAYKAAEQNNPGKAFNKIVEGPWYHSQWANYDGTHHGNIQFGSFQGAEQEESADSSQRDDNGHDDEHFHQRECGAALAFHLCAKQHRTPPSNSNRTDPVVNIPSNPIKER